MKELLLEFQGNVQFFMIFFWVIFLGASITYLLDYIEELFEEDSTRKIVLYVMVATLFAAIITTNIFIFIQGNAGQPA